MPMREQGKNLDFKTSIRRQRTNSDRALRASVVERLGDDPGFDPRGIEVLVENGEVTLNGVVRSRAVKHRVAELVRSEGVVRVWNNLRVLGRGHWTFL